MSGKPDEDRVIISVSQDESYSNSQELWQLNWRLGAAAIARRNRTFDKKYVSTLRKSDAQLLAPTENNSQKASNVSAKRVGQRTANAKLGLKCQKLSIVLMIVLAAQTALAFLLYKAVTTTREKDISVLLNEFAAVKNWMLTQEYAKRQRHLRENYETCTSKATSIIIDSACFYFSKEKLNWTDAKRFCEDIGGSLPTTENEPVNKQLAAHADAQARASNNNSIPYWIGLHSVINSNISDSQRLWVWAESNATAMVFNLEVLDELGSGEVSQDACVAQSAPSSKWLASNCSEVKAFYCSVPVSGTLAVPNL